MVWVYRIIVASCVIGSSVLFGNEIGSLERELDWLNQESHVRASTVIPDEIKKSASRIEIITSQDCKDKLIANTTDAVNRGAFGVPTFFFENQIFFGKDHLHQLEEYIYSNK